MKFNLNTILKTVFEENATDLIVSEGSPPKMRILGELKAIGSHRLTSSEISEMIGGILSDEQTEQFNEEKELDFSYGATGIGRFRVNIYAQSNSVGAAFRPIRSDVPTVEEIALPEVAITLARMNRGLVLVTGPTGSGKSTTLSAMIELINNEKNYHIVTLEDPIEYIFIDKKCIIDQREINTDTKSFSMALKHVLRQSPDVILVGEMRDVETISATLTLAETGHLVYANLHTNDAPQTIHRIVDVFPAYQQQQIRMQLSLTLKGIISQQLLPRADGTGLIAAREIMVITPAISNLIREGKIHQIYMAIQTGQRFGMKTMNQDLRDLYDAGLITKEVALAKSNDPFELINWIGGQGK